MLMWRREILNSKDLVLVNPEDLDVDKITELYTSLELNWRGNEMEISIPMINGIRDFYNACQKIEGQIVLKYKVYRRMLRWIITEGNPKYDAIRFYGWRDALEKFWKFLFGECFHEFYEYLGSGRYRNNDEIWEEWYKCIRGE